MIRISRKFYPIWLNISHILSIIYNRLIYKEMNVQKVISLSIVIIILSFSFLGLFAVPENVNRSFRLIKTVMPYPGKTAVMINRFIKFSPFHEAAPEKNSPMRQKEEKSKNTTGLMFFLLSSFLVCNEKTLLILVLIIALITIKEIHRRGVDYKSLFVPPDIWYYRCWRLKFITPIEKCIYNRADQYDINPIFMNGWALTGLVNKSPHFVRELAECGLFLFVCGMEMFSVILNLIILDTIHYSLTTICYETA